MGGGGPPWGGTGGAPLVGGPKIRNKIKGHIAKKTFFYNEFISILMDLIHISKETKMNKKWIR